MRDATVAAHAAQELFAPALCGSRVAEIRGDRSGSSGSQG